MIARFAQTLESLRGKDWLREIGYPRLEITLTNNPQSGVPPAAQSRREREREREREGERRPKKESSKLHRIAIPIPIPIPIPYLPHTLAEATLVPWIAGSAPSRQPSIAYSCLCTTRDLETYYTRLTPKLGNRQRRALVILFCARLLCSPRKVPLLPPSLPGSFASQSYDTHCLRLPGLRSIPFLCITAASKRLGSLHEAACTCLLLLSVKPDVGIAVKRHFKDLVFPFLLQMPWLRRRCYSPCLSHPSLSAVPGSAPSHGDDMARPRARK
ncbi:hypothetical protein BKA67DRAFT_271533 [Truncatella angustata]|uniref:Uncharacterized protein n=1 Tax=Truncatella angustata TaxID=152316 RepID=A0A9P8ZYM1_9PEZI|nr:uncharacterized protein BKA67DRAFT_271533 [Truncatella angustata]KAH6654170.1 hypothetical protein BKA67DRAFT_271533 [Truncatella angustata]